MTTLRLRPIETWPREQTTMRRDSPFKRSGHYDNAGRYRRDEVPYSQTLRDLDRELEMLGVYEAVLQLAVAERDIRLDGEMRADARPRHPGVILTFKHPDQGPVTFACDAFERWQTNLRAIAKALEALRLVDRYGITTSGEQYAGWKELPSGIPLSATSIAEEVMSVEQAGRIVAGWISGEHDLAKNGRLAVEDIDFRRYAYRQAVKGLHPDSSGDLESTDGFLRLQRAMAVLEGNDVPAL